MITECTLKVGNDSINYLETNPDKNQTLLFIHGNSLNAETFNQQLKSELFDNFRSIALDLPGCGKSSRLNHYSFNSLSNYIIEFINKLELKNIILVGHSLGGDFAIQILEEHQQIKGAFLFGTSPAKLPLQPQEMFLPNPAAGLLFNENLSSEEIELLATNMTTNSQVLVNSIRNTDGKHRLGIGQSIGTTNYKDEFQILKNTRKPFALLFGESDPIVNQDFISSQSFDCIYQSKVLSIEKGTHSPQLDNSIDFNRELIEFANHIFEVK